MGLRRLNLHRRFSFLARLLLHLVQRCLQHFLLLMELGLHAGHLALVVVLLRLGKFIQALDLLLEVGPLGQ